MPVKHCGDHTRYTAGCPDCMVRSREYQKELKERRRTGYNQYRKKNWGIRSDANWEKFHEYARRLGLQ